MKKKLFVLFFMFVLTIALTSCGKKEEETARVTLDINPSYELIIDEEKTVIAVTALNEDASIVLYGESLVGKSLEEATERYKSLYKGARIEKAVHSDCS